MHSFFITGTDTNIGKTAVTCSLIAKYEERQHAGAACPDGHARWRSGPAVSRTSVDRQRRRMRSDPDGRRPACPACLSRTPS